VVVVMVIVDSVDSGDGADCNEYRVRVCENQTHRRQWWWVVIVDVVDVVTVMIAMNTSAAMVVGAITSPAMWRCPSC
jgi:hypothetical protein